MHIPDSMLHGQICPVTAAVSAVGLSGAVYAIKQKPQALKFAAVTAFIFAAQMVNFPVSGATSGHFLGGVLAAYLLGVPLGMISTAIVLSVQALFFGDGGIYALGANILNMSLIGAGLGGLLMKLLSKKWGGMVSLAVASWFSVMLAALACSAELALAGKVHLGAICGAMLGVHALIGIAEYVAYGLYFGYFTG
ncbi:MAG: energy-coupling factor ABC transporter permease [Elusimicrobia bacterium]|nr:energy-coupling factor ABC transporter permease [Elusimicrobiota bacterium]